MLLILHISRERSSKSSRCDVARQGFDARIESRMVYDGEIEFVEWNAGVVKALIAVHLASLENRRIQFSAGCRVICTSRDRSREQRTSSSAINVA